MVRRLLNLLTAVSLLLCVAAVTMWVRSYWRCDSVRWARHNLLDPLPRDGILVEDVYASFECGRATLRWWRYESYEWTGILPDPGFHADSRPSLDYCADRYDRSSRSDLGCWLHRSVAGVDLHAVDERERPGDPERQWYHDWRIGLPLWVIAAGSAALPGLRLLSRGRRRRINGVGVCPTCGYNLTGNVSGVCPECGREVSVTSGG